MRYCTIDLQVRVSGCCKCPGGQFCEYGVDEQMMNLGKSMGHKSWNKGQIHHTVSSHQDNQHYHHTGTHDQPLNNTFVLHALTSTDFSNFM